MIALWLTAGILAKPQTVIVPLVVRDGTDGGELGNKRWFKEKFEQFEEAIEEIAEAPPEERQEAAREALAVFEEIPRTPDVVPSFEAIAAALDRMVERRKGHLQAMREIEAHVAKIKLRKKRNNEAALLLLM